VHFHVFENSLSEENKDTLRGIGEKYPNGEWTFYHVESSDQFVIGNETYLTVETYFRVFIPSLLSSNDKVLWIDGDTVIDGDISELWDVDMLGYCVAGCLEPAVVGGIEKKPKEIKNHYFNAGVMIYNLSEIKNSKIDLHSKAKEIAPQLLNKCSDMGFNFHEDQDCLNYIFKGKVKYLPPKYNSKHTFVQSRDTFTIKEQKEAFLKPLIIHYGGRDLRTISELNVATQNPFWDTWWNYKQLTIFFTDADERKLLEYSERIKSANKTLFPEAYKATYRYKIFDNMAKQLRHKGKKIAVWGNNVFLRYLIVILAMNDIEVSIIVDGMPRNYFEQVYDLVVQPSETLRGKADEYFIILSMSDKAVSNKVKGICMQYGYEKSDYIWVFDESYL
jgi:lipopolysaccharide biosynthesis glycosyltransferase